MADELDRLHLDAALDLLRADAALTVYPDAQGFTPTDPPPPYVVVYASIERPADAPGNALAGSSTTWTVRWYCHCVGDGLYAATAVAGRVRSLLLDVVPTITGRVCGPIRQEAGSPPTSRDETTGPQLHDQAVVYRCTTYPA